eukprot:5782277-Amphidinium_carterae.1
MKSATQNLKSVLHVGEESTRKWDPQWSIPWCHLPSHQASQKQARVESYLESELNSNGGWTGKDWTLGGLICGYACPLSSDIRHADWRCKHR